MNIDQIQADAINNLFAKLTRISGNTNLPGIDTDLDGDEAKALIIVAAALIETAEAKRNEPDVDES